MVTGCGSVLGALTLAACTNVYAAAVGATIPATMLGANVVGCEAGWAVGMFAEADGGRKAELARLLNDHGVRCVRLPGGTLANRFFWDSEAATREAAAAAGGGFWSGRPNDHMYNYFVSFDQAAAFCRDAGVTLIWQLNCATVHDEEGLHLLAVSPTGADLIPAVRFDHGDKLAAAVESVRRFARHIHASGLPVPLFEMGNEEYGHPVLDPVWYAQIVRAYTEAVKAELPDCRVLVTLGDNQMVQGGQYLQWAEAVLNDLAEHGLADKIDSFTLHYSWRSVCEFAIPMLDRHGFTRQTLAVTEFTCGWPDYWEKTPRFRHAVQVAEFVMDLLAVPRVEVACIHDLMSQNFGIFHYNQRSFEPPDDRSYDGRLGYVVTPTAQAYSLLKPLAGARLLSASGALVEAEADGRYVAVLSNTSDKAVTHRLRPAAYGLTAASATLTVLTAESPEATVGVVQTRALAADGEEWVVEMPALSVARVDTAQAGR